MIQRVARGAESMPRGQARSVRHTAEEGRMRVLLLDTKARTLLGWRPKYGLDETIERSMAGFVPCAATPAP